MEEAMWDRELSNQDVWIGKGVTRTWERCQQ